MEKRSIVWKRKDADTAEKRDLQFVDGSQQGDNIVIHEPIEYFSKLLDQSMLDKLLRNPINMQFKKILINLYDLLAVNWSSLLVYCML